MKVKFDILFEVEFQHEYFSKGQLKDFDVKPTDLTAQLLNDYGLLFRKTSKGFVVLYEIDAALALEPPLKPLVDGEKISFEIYMQSPYFTNFTNIPLNQKLPKCFYFNNLDENIVDGHLMLSKQNHTGADDVLELNSGFYNVFKSTSGLFPQLEVLDLQKSTVFSKPVYAPDNLLDYQLELDKLGLGWFEIRVEGAKENILYADQILHKKPIFAIVDIFKSDLVPGSYRFAAADGTVSKKTYAIRFARRSTIWKYFVILQNIPANPGFDISYGTRILPEEKEYPVSVNFNQKNIATLTPSELSIVNEFGSDQAIVFESNKKLPLYEIPKQNINLHKPETPEDVDSEREIVIGNLPNATAAAIKTNAANTETFSEIFIYV